MAVSGDLEGIDRVSGRRRTNVGFQAVAAHHIDGAIKQTWLLALANQPQVKKLPRYRHLMSPLPHRVFQ
jgi:hypothetical protein